MMNSSANRCLTSKQVVEFASNTHARNRLAERVETHIRQCEECWFLVKWFTHTVQNENNAATELPIEIKEAGERLGLRLR